MASPDDEAVSVSSADQGGRKRRVSTVSAREPSPPRPLRGRVGEQALCRLGLPLPLVALRLHVVERRLEVGEALLRECGAGPAPR